MENKLTIILTIKGRSGFTIRWMEYMNSINCPYKIFIADGGDDESLKNNLLNQSNYPNISYEYFLYPYDKTTKEFYKKFIDITDKVNTQYVLYTDNDDYLLLDEFDTWINFLDNNPNYVSCGGDSAQLSVYSKDNKSINESMQGFNECYGANSVIRHDKHDQFSNEANIGIDRVCEYLIQGDMDKTWLIWYDILRTEAVKKTHNYMKTYEFKDIVTFEMYKNLSLLMIGKNKKFDFVSYIRQVGTSELNSSLSKEFNVVERFIKIDGFKEVLKGLNYIDDSITYEDETKIIKSFSIWFSYTTRRLYSPSSSRFKLFRENLSIILNHGFFYQILIKVYFNIKNLISKNKVYFLHIKSIKNSLSIRK